MVQYTKCNGSTAASASAIDCGCNAIVRIKTTTYLSIMIDQNLNFKPQIRTVAKKNRNFIYIAKLLKASAPKNINIQVYVSLCQSVLQYYVGVLAPTRRACWNWNGRSACFSRHLRKATSLLYGRTI